MNILDIVRRKAKDVYDILWRPVIVEDTWLFIDALVWYPWPFVKHIIEWLWIWTLVKTMDWIDNRVAKAITWIAMFDWTRYVDWLWELPWIMPESPRWDKFWWSNIFQPEWSDLTFWEMTEEQKNEISMRKLALDSFTKNYKRYKDA